MKGKIKPDDIVVMLAIAFILTGIMLYVYCVFEGINVGDVVEVSNPIFYLMIGINGMIVAVLDRKGLIGDCNE